MDAQRGIRKPRELSAALSIRTVYTPDGQTRPYDDSVGSDGLLRYKWRGDNPDQAENKALRAAMENRLPLMCALSGTESYSTQLTSSPT
jgi:putative restriction endonuclease